MQNSQKFHSVFEASLTFDFEGQYFTFQSLEPIKRMLQTYYTSPRYKHPRKAPPIYVNVHYSGDNSERRLLFHHAVTVGNLYIIKAIIARMGSRSPELFRGSDYSIALNIACEYGHYQVAMFLARWCSYETDTRGTTPMHWLFVFAEEETRELASFFVRGGLLAVRVQQEYGSRLQTTTQCCTRIQCGR